MKFAPNFPKSEMIFSRSATTHHVENEPTLCQEKNLVRVSWFLQTLKERLSSKYETNVIINVTSGFRCEWLNNFVGSTSKVHKRGLAADIQCPLLSSLELAKFISDNMVDVEFDQVIEEYGKWVHVGLSTGEMRGEVLTARTVGNKTQYTIGLNDG